MVRAVVPIAFTLGCVGWLMRAEARRDVRSVWLAKPLASLGFVLTAVRAGAFETPYGQAILAALVLSLIGDVLLIPSGPKTFLAGLGSFLLGHVAFAAAFWLHGVARPAVNLTLAALFAAALFVARWLLPHVKGALRPAVVAYMTVISVMVALAVGALFAGGSAWIAIGAVMFYASDLAVARDRFVSPGFVNRAWGLPAYYGAQLVLACTVLSR